MIAKLILNNSITNITRVQSYLICTIRMHLMCTTLNYNAIYGKLTHLVWSQMVRSDKWRWDDLSNLSQFYQGIISLCNDVDNNEIIWQFLIKYKWFKYSLITNRTKYTIKPYRTIVARSYRKYFLECPLTSAWGEEWSWQLYLCHKQLLDPTVEFNTANHTKNPRIRIRDRQYYGKKRIIVSIYMHALFISLKLSTLRCIVMSRDVVRRLNNWYFHQLKFILTITMI